MGRDITYSGTVAAALEGQFSAFRRWQFPSISVTPARLRITSWRPEIAVTVAKRVINKGLPPLTILNLNIPSVVSRRSAAGRAYRGTACCNDVLERNGDVIRIGGQSRPALFEQQGTDLWGPGMITTVMPASRLFIWI